ncbi:MAG: 2-amino-4-hydroxy-6-hydroxymethyldihydropteridine diphosphokinase [Bacteroidota bacterium]
MAKLYLGMGTNKGDRAKQLADALEACGRQLGHMLIASPIYETAAWGIEEQADFLNQVVLVETSVPPLECLEIVLDIEAQLGRQRMIKWGPREIDIDLLFYDDLIFQDHRLSLPHPYIQERRFVLQPLADIAGEFVHPVLDQSINDLLAQTKDASEVVLWS